MRKSLPFFLAVILVVVSTCQLYSQIIRPQITVDHIEITEGDYMSFFIRLNNPNNIQFDGVLNGFIVYSPDGAEWSSTIADTINIPGFDWEEQFDLIYQINHFNADGSGVDTVGFFGAALTGSGIYEYFNEIAYEITIGPVDPIYQSSSICIDSSWYPPNGTWKWAANNIGQTTIPEWDGPYCFSLLNEIRTWYVKADGTGDVPTIKDAIETAVNYDTILVAPGYYAGEGSRQLELNGKILVIKSESGPENTIIDIEGNAGNPSRGFVISNNTSHVTRIEGFTIKNGYLADGKGSGIQILNSFTKPTLKNCIIENCHSEFGGGMHTQLSGVLMDSCIFRNNTAHSGAAFRMNDEMDINSVISNCVFENNFATGSGGAGFLYFSRPIIINSQFLNNGSNSHGGAMFGMIASTRMDSCTFSHNTAGGIGGALYMFESFVDIQNSLFNHNSASIGGAVYWRFPDLAAAEDSVAALATEIAASPPQFLNSTFVLNSADTGSVLYTDFIPTGFIHFNSDFTIENSILAFNSGYLPIKANDSRFVPFIQCSDIFGNSDGDWVGEISNQETLRNNFSQDPLFCDIDNEDYTLNIQSPCLTSNNSCNLLIGHFDLGCTGEYNYISSDPIYLLSAFNVNSDNIEISSTILPPGYNASDINLSTVMVNDTVLPEASLIFTDNIHVDGDGITVFVTAHDFILSYGFLYDVTEQVYTISGEMNDGTPFEIESGFTFIGHRSGDVNLDGNVDIADLVFSVEFFFNGATPPIREEALDIDRDGIIDIGDIIMLIDYMF